MNIRFSAFRSGVRNPTFALSGPPMKFRTPYPTRRKAVRLYHEEGLAEANAYWDHAMRVNYRTPGGLRTRALNTRAAFNRYVAWDSQDGRPFGDYEVEADISLGANTLTAMVDVVVLDAAGVSGRILLWDLYGCTAEQASVLSAPACLALDEVYGAGRATSVEVWDLRGNQRWTAARQVALGWQSEAQRYLDRIART